MSDLIRRQDAIDAIVAWTVEDRPDVEMPTDLIDRITGLPSAQPEQECEKCIFKPFKQFQPERKKGKWIDQDDGAFYPVECSECRKIPLFDLDGDYILTNFCPNCGADMRGEQNGND